jgi:hypothetical protein
LVELSKPTENGGCLPFLAPALPKELEFGWYVVPKGKIEQKSGHQLTQKRDSEGWLRWLLRQDSMRNRLNSA